MKLIQTLPLLLALTGAPLFAQEGGDAGATFDSATGDLDRQLEESLAELAALREQIAEEKIPLNRKLNDLQSELSEVRSEYQSTTRMLDSRTLDLSNLRSEIKLRKDEASYLDTLLGDYIRNFESRLHIAEKQRYDATLEAAKLAPENTNLQQEEIFQTQVNLLSLSIERLQEALGGTAFDGTAVADDGLVHQGKFTLLGPAALFRSTDGNIVGTAEEELNSNEPRVLAFGDPLDVEAAGTLGATGEGFFPLDPTMGNAHKIEAVEETFLEHVQKGGAVMVPIFAMAGAALLVALYKWLTFMMVRTPTKKSLTSLLDAVGRDDKEAAGTEVVKIRGPVGRMLASGVEHMNEPHELIEEVMYENVLTTRLKLQRMLPFIAICAASAPLLGLLGTVTGIINTFKMITVFGSGDVKSLSGGISEALITTKFGLIVAIPSLLLHAFLSRKARGVVSQMEAAAVSFVNQARRHEKRPTARVESSDDDGLPSVEIPGNLPDESELAQTGATRQQATAMQAQVKDALNALLTPIVMENIEKSKRKMTRP